MKSKKPPAPDRQEAKTELVPKLRFPEFRDAWEKKTLGTLGYFTGGGTPSKQNANYWTGEIPWISSSDLTEDSISQINISRFITKQAVQESATKLVPANSILLISRVGVGKLAVSSFPICTSQDFTNFTPSVADPFFLAYFLKSKKETLLSLNQGTSIKGFTKDNIASLRFSFPSLAEQRKIAECLSSVDEVMAAQVRKLEVLKTHKKGLMQQLFPREGETRPRLRFPEFRDAGEWEKRKVSSLLARSVSPVSVAAEKTYHEIGIRSHGKGIFHKEPVLGKALGDKRVFRVEENALVLNIVFAWEQAVAVTSEAERGMIASHRFPMYKTKEGESDVDFIKFFFLTNKGKELLGIASPGGAGRNKTLGQKEFEKLEFLCPGKVEEQTAIARCLSSVDELIAAETRKLEVLKTHKKGLMQQLFPSPEEVKA